MRFSGLVFGFSSLSSTLVSLRFSVAGGCCAPCCVVPLFFLKQFLTFFNSEFVCFLTTHMNSLIYIEVVMRGEEKLHEDEALKTEGWSQAFRFRLRISKKKIYQSALGVPLVSLLLSNTPSITPRPPTYTLIANSSGPQEPRYTWD